MPVTIEPTPNPNALKFSVGRPVEGPRTFVAGQETDDPLANALLALPNVSSVFMTSDFVTLSKVPQGDWQEIAPRAQRILEEHFGGP
ncbi:MAG: NifU N-terminal domain-containing protein [Actinomycetota bacterium]|nr:NifU N-terminal domain-containing protein [Actinomycetota bacterium]